MTLSAYLDVDELRFRSSLEGIVLCTCHQADVVAEVPFPVPVSDWGHLILFVFVQEGVVVVELVPVSILNDKDIWSITIYP